MYHESRTTKQKLMKTLAGLQCQQETWQLISLVSYFYTYLCFNFAFSSPFFHFHICMAEYGYQEPNPRNKIAIYYTLNKQFLASIM